MNQENKMKTYEEVDRLVHDVLLHPDFNIQDLRNFIAKCEHNRFNSYIKSPANQNNTKSMDGWHEGSVKIKLPPEDGKRRAKGEAEAPEFEVGSINYRPILETVYKALDDPEASAFHYTPYQELWKPDYLSEAERIYGELYSSDIWLESHEEIQRLPRINEVDNFVLPILLYSDSTHLTNFGSASLWPFYMFLGGHSKYLHCKSAESTCNHLAYIPLLPHNIQDVYKRHYGRAASSQALTHLRRELMQAVLSLAVLQPDFLNAYKNGFLFLCCDGVHRRLFPRIMVYSADYPECMLVASLKTMGAFPCASCEIPNKFIHMLRTRADEQRKAHKHIDNEAKQDKDCLGPYSLIPTRNAFSSLSKFGFNFHDMFTPDLLHEFELGVWKSIFIHLIRIIVAEGGDLISTLNIRYRLIPPFGRSTIQCFPQSTAAMTKLAGRDYEDILQCSIPVFEGMLRNEKHTKIILDLLFALNTWHALTKLHLHTDTTVRIFENATRDLGRQVWIFKKEIAGYNTRELPKEVEARGHRRAVVRRTCLYRTQIGESQHKHVKHMFGRTNKQNAARDVAKVEGRGRQLRDLKRRIEHTQQLGNAAPDAF
ncbi:hypothetical protein ACEPAI_9512 [Sanghuangporus weigelae]